MTVAAGRGARLAAGTCDSEGRSRGDSMPTDGVITSPPRSTLALGASLALLLLVVRGAGAAPPGPAPDSPRQASASPRSHPPSPDPLDELATFLSEYHRALTQGDLRFLEQHTQLPLPTAGLAYDLEATSRPSRVPDVAALARVRRRLRWPEPLLARNGERLRALRRGVERCSDPVAPDRPDFGRGKPAVELSGDRATLTYLAEPCAAETHVVILELALSGGVWRLTAQRVRPGTE